MDLKLRAGDMARTRTFRAVVAALMVLAVVGAAGAVPAREASAQTQGSSKTFTETGKTVKGKFLDYWNAHGGLAQQGYPISEQVQERSDTDGKTYTVQYFERAVFELHPENQPPNDVLLSLLGVFLYNQKYPGGAPDQHESKVQGGVLFSVTGKHVGGIFLKYWLDHGGLAQQGFPISEEFTEVNDLDHQPYTVQYFERAVFEYHPENDPPYNVLLSQLGRFRYNAKHGKSSQVMQSPTLASVHIPVVTGDISDRTNLTPGSVYIRIRD